MVHQNLSYFYYLYEYGAIGGAKKGPPVFLLVWWCGGAAHGAACQLSFMLGA